MVRAFVLLTAALLVSPASAAGLSATAQAEIQHLLLRLEQSGCEFHRNGRWYSAADARRHLERKYRYLVEKSLVSSAEDFITRAGSESSMSGRPYQVRCGTTEPVPSARWLTEELRRHRSAPLRTESERFQENGGEKMRPKIGPSGPGPNCFREN